MTGHPPPNLSNGRRSRKLPERVLVGEEGARPVIKGRFSTVAIIVEPQIRSSTTRLQSRGESTPPCGTPSRRGHRMGLARECSTYIPIFQHGTDPSAYSGLDTMLSSSLYYCVEWGSVKGSLYVKECSKGNILVLDSIFYACYHIVQCSFSRFTYVVGMLVSVQGINPQFTVPNVSIY
jgi:hypothetical protein